MFLVLVGIFALLAFMIFASMVGTIIQGLTILFVFACWLVVGVFRVIVWVGTAFKGTGVDASNQPKG